MTFAEKKKVQELSRKSGSESESEVFEAHRRFDILLDKLLTDENFTLRKTGSFDEKIVILRSSMVSRGIHFAASAQKILKYEIICSQS